MLTDGMERTTTFTVSKYTSQLTSRYVYELMVLVQLNERPHPVCVCGAHESWCTVACGCVKTLQGVYEHVFTIMTDAFTMKE